MVNTVFNSNELKKAIRLRSILIACGICILLTVVLHLFTRPVDVLFEGIETLLGVSSLVMGIKQNKKIQALRAKQHLQ